MFGLWLGSYVGQWLGATGVSEPPVSQPGGGLPSRKGVKRAKDWLRHQLEREIKRSFKKKPKRAVEVFSLPEPRKTLRLSVKRTDRPIDFEKLLKRQEMKKQVLSVVERRVEEDLLRLFEVERTKAKKRRAKRRREEEFLLLYL